MEAKLAEEMTRAERIREANKARKLLEEFGEYVARAEEKYKDDWARAQTAEDRELLWHKHAALKEVIWDLQKLIGDGRIAEEEEKHER